MKTFHTPHPHDHPLRFEKMLPWLWALVGLLAAAAFFLDDPASILAGLKTIAFSESALITDYVLIAGPGAALMNAALVSAITLLLLHHAQETPNGLTPVVLGLMAGFSLFGKNFLNIWPILLGCRTYALLRREPFGTYINIGLMATALSPMVSYVAIDNGWGNPVIAVLLGFAVGFIMPPLSAYTFRVQNGMNLYNVGFACGLLAFILVPLISSMGAAPNTYYHWASGYNRAFGLLLAGLCLLLMLAGPRLCRVPLRQALRGYRDLLRTSGRAPSDYLRMFGPAPVLINTGVNGLLGLAFILLAGGDLNGPTVGGILTVMGFSAFGKHAGNIIPVMLGVALGGTVMDFNLYDPAVQLACLFCTTLAPISGYFGWPYGVLAGFLHSCVVLYTGSPVAGLNLYNNGFSGGLIAIVLYPCIIAIAHHRKPALQDSDYFEQMENDAPVKPAIHEQFSEEACFKRNRSEKHRHPYE